MNKRSSAYRWVIEALLFFAFVGSSLIWLAPAPILGPIIKDLKISLAEAGLIISVIAICIAVFSLIGATLAERIGALRAYLAGLWMLALGAVLSGYAHTLAALLGCRVLEGIGFGFMTAPPASLVMQWFSEREWPYINMVNALCSYIGLTAVFLLTPGIYYALGSSWQAVLRDYGLAFVAVALAWSLLGREKDAAAATIAPASALEGSLKEVFRLRDVRLIAFSLFGGMWVFQLYTAFLPEFFHTYRGLSLSEAANLTAVLPLAGMFAAAAGGFGTGLSGLRKPFTWPVAILSLLGCLGAVSLAGAVAVRFSLVLLGIGSAGSLAAIGTLLLELPGMTPAKAASANALIWSVGYAAAFISPFLGGAIASAVGLKSALLLMLILQFMPIVGMFLIPETGPGRKARVAVAAAAGR